MNVALQFLIRHGYTVVFLWVLGEQAGLPIPAVPLLLAAGNLTSLGTLNVFLILSLGVLACLMADTAWFLLGRRYGGRVLKLLCRISLEPDSCVRRTDDRIGKHGARLLLFAKFVPGLNTVAVPIAGRSGISLRSFLIYDSLGSVLWVVAFTIAGRLCGPALLNVSHNLPTGTIGVLLTICGIAAYISWKIRRRQKFLADLRIAKVTPEELLQMIKDELRPFIVDLRHPLDILPDPRTLPTAIKIAPGEIAARLTEIPVDRDIILFCTCPNEATSARVALLLRKNGIKRIRPLQGGLDAWRKRGFPLDTITLATNTK